LKLIAKEFKGVTSRVIEEISDSTPYQWPAEMQLPDELAEWARDNHDMIRRIQLALFESYIASPTEDQIWEVIAATSGDPAWLKARENMREAEHEWNNLNHPMNAPLGAIGAALEGPEIERVSERFAISLADFTTINEGLRQRQDLSTLLSVLLVQKRMLDQSTQRTREVVNAAKDLAEMFSLSRTFKRSAKKPSRIRKHFREYTQQFLASGKQQAWPTNVTVPWLLET
jgi:hypothetical protein